MNNQTSANGQDTSQHISAMLDGLELSGEVRHNSIEAALIVHRLHLDEDAMQAAALHLAWRDELVPRKQLRGRASANAIALLTGMEQLRIIEDFTPTPSDQEAARQTERFRRMLLAMVEDARVVVISLAHHVQHLRAAKALPREQQQTLARRTLDVHAPLANRLGIWQLKWELEDLSLRYLDPDSYHHIARWLDERRVDRENYINDAIEQLRDHLKRHHIQADITGRPKHLYSIWKKLQSKKLSLDTVYDASAVRLLVEDVPACYAALGAIHSRWRPIPGQFDDYIASPKDNLYQSLHTAVIGPLGRPLEVQIRTREMHEHAEYGVASHWRYKEGTHVDTAFERRIAWLRRLLDGDGADDNDLMEDFRAEIRQERVYAITPRGHIMDLPRGATVLDFAYAIHTEVGHRCRGARINGSMVPLTRVLENGDQVEILTGRVSQPSRDWLVTQFGYLATGRARNKVRHWFKEQDHDKNVASGRSLVERELRRLGAEDTAYDELARRFGFDQPDDFLAAVGSGDITTAQISGRVARLNHERPAAERRLEELPPMPARTRAGDTPGNGIHIQGIGNLMTTIAQCCRPAPPEEIVGYITRTRGVSVHRSDCKNILRLTRQMPERLVEASWGGSARRVFPVDVHIEAYDRSGLLRDITHLMATEGLNVLGVTTRTDPTTQLAAMDMTVEVTDLPQLSRVLNQLSRLPHVFEARRKK